MRLTVTARIACVIAAVGCSSSTAPHRTGSTGITLTAGNQQTDTIGGVLSQALDVQVPFGPAGQSPAGQVVQFVSVLDSAESSYEVYTEALTSQQVLAFAAESLDANGRASIVIVMGARAGPARLVVKVPEFGYVDTARFTVTPGNIASIGTTPIDTAVITGSSVTLIANTQDRAGNPRSDPVQITVASGPATISGKTVTTTGVGRITLITSAGTLADTTHVSAVPQGTLAVSTGTGITMFHFDGTGSQTISLTPPVGNIKWAPSGKSLVFDQSSYGCSGNTNLLQTTDLKGNVTAIDRGTAYDMYPSYSRDGTWIYWTSNTGSSAALWRAHPDGTSDDSLTTMNPGFDIYPTASPSGTQVAYSDIATGQSDLRVLTLSTGAVTDLGINGWSPEWSPTGNQIAYIQGSSCTGIMAIVNSDGTGAHVLTSSSYQSSFDWSPDGKWLVALNINTGKIDLINATTGETLPLNFTGSQSSPTWMP